MEVKITHYLAGFILGANLVIVGNGGRASAGRERQACLSCLSCVDGRSTQAFVYIDHMLLMVDYTDDRSYSAWRWYVLLSLH